MSIVEATIKDLKYSFNIKYFTDDFYGELCSTVFNFAEGKWYVRVVALKDNPDFIAFYLHKMSGETVNVSLKTSILVDDKSLNALSFTYKYDEIIGYGWKKFIARKRLIKEISQHYSFTLVCEMQIIEHSKFHPSVHMKIPSQLRMVCSRDFHDLEIQVKDSDQSLSAHRNIISAYSPVLYEKIRELKNANPLKIEDFGFETVQEVINFINGKDVNKTDENVKEILLAAKKYQIEDLLTECEKFIFQKVSVENSLKTLVFADESGATYLFDEIVNFVDKNIDVCVKQQPEWELLVSDHPRMIKALFIKFMENRLKKFKEHSPTLGNTEGNESLSENCNADQCCDLTNDYGNLFKEMEFSDVSIEVNGKTLKAHKNILWCRSSVFRAMFSHDTLESKENRVKITDIDYYTMQQLLQYIYCGKVTGLKGNAIKLFSASDKYDLMKLKDLCKSSMEKNITVGNVTEILKLADLHSYCLAELKELAFSFLKKNFERVSKTVRWEAFAESNSKILNDMIIKFLVELE